MLRIVVGVLAAFVGFSLGHSIPKWMENKRKCATPRTPQPPPSSSPPSSPEGNGHFSKKLMLRRKSLRKFKFGSHKSGQGSLDDAESTASVSAPHSAVHYSKRYCFRSKKASNEDMGSISTTMASVKGTTYLDDEICTDNSLHSEFEADFCNNPSDVNVLRSPSKAKRHVKQWKVKLTSLRSKAMETEQVWFEKLSKKGSSGKSPDMALLSKGSARKPVKDKENQSPLLTLSYSSSGAGLLEEGPKSGMER